MRGFSVALVIVVACFVRPAIAQTQSPSTSPPDSDCARPNEPPRVVSAAPVRYPPEEHGTAEVEVLITLDARSNMVGSTIYASSDPTYDDTALQVTRASKFATEIIGCRPRPASYRFVVDFVPQAAKNVDPDCPVRNAPAHVVFPQIPAGRRMANPRPEELFDAQIGVDLDEQSHILNATVISSNDPEFAKSALLAARSTRFKTAVVDCKPVKQSIIYRVQHSMSS